jgi:hypothetical protein
VVIDTARWLTRATTNATLRDVLGVNGRLLLGTAASPKASGQFLGCGSAVPQSRA